MVQNHQALKVALAAVQQLPTKLQQQLAEHLLRALQPEKNTVVVSLQRLSQQKQVRLARLMDKHNNGRLSPTEQKALQQLGAEVDQCLLANSQALARALRPELFDERGRPLKRRFQHALQDPTSGELNPNRSMPKGDGKGSCSGGRAGESTGCGEVRVLPSPSNPYRASLSS